MAYAALVSLSQSINLILNHRQFSVSLHQKQQITSIDKYVILLQAFLEEFPGNINSLEGRITEVANEAEDTMDHLMWEYYRSMSCIEPLQVMFRDGKFAHKLKKVTKELDLIAEQVMDIKDRFTINDDGQPSDFSAASSSSSRLSPTCKDAMVGFDGDLVAIKVRLCGESSKLQFIPIFGMGGIGKTTLARNAYDDPLIIEHFDIRAWVTISHDYSVQEILSGLLVSMKIFVAKRSGETTESMVVDVHKTLKARRYLIVMDDIWSREAWDDVRNIFHDDENGSRIILTTRLLDVAKYANSCSPPHEMRFMDADQSWNLLRQKVFRHRNCPPELENMGKEIARRCSGLPLAIVVIAGVLSAASRTRASWKEIAENVTSAVDAKDGHVGKILSLSYTHLPYHLRPCFLYMGGFPEDYEIRVSKLIKLWIAEGFLKHPNGSKSFEEGSQEYLEDLVKRSLIVVNSRKSNGKIKSCSMHDLMRELCIRKAQQDKFLLNVMDRHALNWHALNRHALNRHALSFLSKHALNRRHALNRLALNRHAQNRHALLNTIKNQLRISLAHSDINYLTQIYGSGIRTIMCFKHSGNSPISLRNFRLIRVLNVVHTYVELLGFRENIVLPAELFDLFHLRFLAVGGLMNIPAAISNLQNLQTLIIQPRKTRRYLSHMLRLPVEIWRMPQLRHLEAFYFGIPNPEMWDTLALENLQTLSVATASVCTKRILEMIPNLKKLGILNSGDGEDCHLDNLVHLRQLEKLKVYGGFRSQRKLNPTFPTTLKKLTLSGRLLPWEDMKIVGSLPNLEVLKLRNSTCYGRMWETSEEEFPQLIFLLIDGSDLEDWITESNLFPSLKCLRLYRCVKLSEIPDGIGEIPTLELIEVDKKNISLVESAKHIQEKQKYDGNDSLQVRFVSLPTASNECICCPGW